MKRSILSICLLSLASITYSQNKSLGVGVAVPNPNAALDVNSPTGNQGMLIPRLTSAQITALSLVLGAADKGMMIYNKDTNNLIIWNGVAFGISVAASSTDANAAIFGTTTGTGPAGFFQNTNAANTNTTLYGGTNGIGNAIAVRGDNTNAANTAAAIYGSTVGSGVGIYGITTGTGAAIQGYTATGGIAIYGTHDGASNGFAGLFRNLNAANTFPAIQAMTVGTGPGVRVIQNATSAGSGIDVLLQNTASTALGLSVNQQGLGSAGYFIKSGTGNNTTLYSQNSAVGSAGDFNVDNPSSSSSVLFAASNGTGAVIHANHTGPSGPIAIFNSSNVTVARIDKAGRGFFNNGTQTGGADIAEMFDVEGARENYEPGDVLVISEATDRTVEKSSSPSSSKVVGVYATKPGVTLTEKGIDENLDRLVPMGVIGVIPTKVCNENGAIKRGDLLVTSSTSGHAMKAIAINGDGVFPAGVIIGKALENFEGKQTGIIKVLVNIK
jgi:trimeric autotransporter adhesin